MKEIVAAIVALGAMAALAHWILKRWFSHPSEIIRLEEQINEITLKIVATEKKHPTYSNRKHLNELYAKRVRLNEKIKSLRKS